MQAVTPESGHLFITLRHPTCFLTNTAMKLSVGNLALLQATPSRSPSPEIPQDQKIAEIERECNALARRLARQGRADCLLSQELVFTQERLRRADGREIPKQMKTWQDIERFLAAQFPPLATNFAQARKSSPSSQAQLRQRQTDESHLMLKEKLGSWFGNGENGKPQRLSDKSYWPFLILCSFICAFTVGRGDLQTPWRPAHKKEDSGSKTIETQKEREAIRETP